MKAQKIEISLPGDPDTEVIRYYRGTAAFALDDTSDILDNFEHRNELGLANRQWQSCF